MLTLLFIVPYEADFCQLGINTLNYLLTYSFTHSLTQSLIHSLTHSAHSMEQSLS